MTVESLPATEPVFTVLDVEAVPHSATPTLRFHLHVNDPLGREVHTIVLSTQIQIDPARRTYDPQTRARLIELFGAPERWASTTQVFRWAHVDVLVKGFVGATSFELEVPCTYDLEVAAAKYFYALRDGEAPMAFHFNGRVLYRGEDGGLQVVLVPWTCTADFRLPVVTWREMMDRHHPEGGWVRLQDPTIAALRRRATERGLPSLDAALAELLEE